MDADNNESLWPGGGSGQCTDKIIQTERGTTSISYEL